MIGNNRLDSRVLGQILLLQSSLYSAPDELRVGEQVCYTLISVPGVLATALYIDDNLVAHRTSSSERFTQWPDSRTEIFKQNFTKNICEYSLKLIPLQTIRMVYGHLVLVMADTDIASYYISFLENTANQIALLLENRKQKTDLLLLNDRLEAQVQVRTRALAENERLLRSTFEYATIGMCLTDIDGYLLMVNPELCNLLGYSQEALVSKNFSEFTHPDDIALSFKKIKLLLNGKLENTSFEKRYLHRSGRVIWVSVGTCLVRDDKGGAKYFVTHIEDITEKKLAVEALEKSEDKYRNLFENLFDVYYHTDDKGTISLISPSVERILGYLPEELIGQKMADVYVYPQQREEFLSMLIRYGYVEDFEAPVHHKDNSIVWVSTNAKVLKDKDGNFVRVEGLTRDITARRSVEEENEMSMKRFQALIQLNQITETTLPEITDFALEEAIRLTQSSIGYLAFLNDDESVLTMHSWSKRTMKKCEITDKPITYPVADTGLWGEAVRQRKTIITNDYSASNPLKKGLPVGHVTLLRHMNVPIFDNDKIVVLAGVGNKEGGYTQTDADQIYLLMQGMWHIIQRKRAGVEHEKLHNQLMQAQKMEAVGRLAGGVAHDFNNMLSVIIGNADMAMDGLDPTMPLYAELNEIKKAGDRSADLTRQLLAFARKQTVSPRVLDLNKVLSGMINMLQRLIGEDIDLIWRPGHTVEPVKMDPSQLDQILANLCVNARDAISDIGKVTIETGNTTFDKAYCRDHLGFLPGNFSFLAVSDNGCGMDTETLKNIFEPFFTTKKSGQGTGLGLATVYGVVKQNKGFVNVYSEPNMGTTFKIYLPHYQDRLDESLDQVQMHPTQRGHETILLVEDEIAILEMTALMLERMGYQVVAAKTPDEAIHLAQSYTKEIHLLMTDVIMPEMNGRDLAKKILPIRPNLKRLFMSGYTANVIAHHGIVDEGVHFIQKPFSRQQLSQKVREVLDHVKKFCR